MLRRIQPEVGTWYENREQECLFEVVSIEEDDGTLAVQYFEGELEEMDIETFLQLPLRVVDQPEDWAGPFEIDAEDRDDQEYYADTGEQHNDYFPFDDFESSGVRVYDDF